jgi:hypothetical protein
MGVFMLCLGVGQTLIMLWQLRIAMRSQGLPAADISAPTKGRFGYWPVLAMAILAAAGWVPYVFHIGQQERAMVTLVWGSGADGCYQVSDAAKLSIYANKYNVFLACGLSSATIDQMQDGLNCYK